MPVVVRLNNSNKLAAALESGRELRQRQHRPTPFRSPIPTTREQWGYPEGDERPADRQSKSCLTGAAPFFVQFCRAKSSNLRTFLSRMNSLGDAGSLHRRRTVRGAAGTRFLGLPGAEWQPRGDRRDAQQRKHGRHHDRAGPFRTQPPHRRPAARSASTAAMRNGGDRRRCSSAKSRRPRPRFAVRATTGTVYFLVEVLDEAISRDDYVNILSHPPTRATGSPSARRIKVSHSGLKKPTDILCRRLAQTDMGSTQCRPPTTARSADNSDTDNGYLVEVAVPRPQLDLASGEDSREPRAVRQPGAARDAICPTSSRSIATWIPIAGL